MESGDWDGFVFAELDVVPVGVALVFVLCVFEEMVLAVMHPDQVFRKKAKNNYKL